MKPKQFLIGAVLAVGLTAAAGVLRAADSPKLPENYARDPRFMGIARSPASEPDEIAATADYDAWVKAQQAKRETQARMHTFGNTAVPVTDAQMFDECPQVLRYARNKYDANGRLLGLEYATEDGGPISYRDRFGNVRTLEANATLYRVADEIRFRPDHWYNQQNGVADVVYVRIVEDDSPQTLSEGEEVPRGHYPDVPARVLVVHLPTRR